MPPQPVPFELRLDPADLAYVIIRVAESFIWRELITGEEPDLDRGCPHHRYLLYRHRGMLHDHEDFSNV